MAKYVPPHMRNRPPPPPPPPQVPDFEVTWWTHDVDGVQCLFLKKLPLDRNARYHATLHPDGNFHVVNERREDGEDGICLGFFDDKLQLLPEDYPTSPLAWQRAAVWDMYHIYNTLRTLGFHEKEELVRPLLVRPR